MKKSKFNLKIVGFVFGALVLAGVTFYFGASFLRGDLVGSDSPHAVSHVNYLYKYWPQKTLWQPIFGRGMSLLGINYGGFWVAAMTARIAGWTPIQATQFWQITNMFLAGVGVFALGWLLIGYLGGLLAGVFFLLNEISWIWQARIGLFEFQGALVFFPLFFFCLHYYLKNIGKLSKLKTGLLFLGLAVILCLAIWWHLVVAVLIIEASFFYVLFFPKKDSVPLFNRLFRWIKVVLTGVLLSSFFILPYYFYNSRMLAGKFEYFTSQNLPLLPWLSFWGLKSWQVGGVDIWQSYFALPVIVFCILGLIVSLFKKNKLVILLFVLSLLASLQASDLVMPLAKIFLTVFSTINVRAIIIAVIFLPIVAGYGVSEFSGLIIFWVKNKYIKASLVFLISILLVYFGLKFLDRVPVRYPDRCGSSYGAEETWFCSKISALGGDLKYIFSPHDGFFEKTFLSHLASFIPDSPNVGADLTSFRGRFIEEWSLVSNISLMQAYDYAVPLEYVSYSAQKFYIDGKPEEVGQIASWLGSDYLILDRQTQKNIDVLYKDWEKVYDTPDMVLVKSPKPTGLGTYSARPVILFFGDNRQESYFKFWQMLADGGLNYSQAFLVKGEERLENYSLTELSKFNLVVLWGENYKNTDKANKLIKKYLEGGGNVLIDTGWENTSFYWQKENLPDWLPILATSWHSLPLWELYADRKPGFAPESWAVPRWNGQNWGASGAKVSDLQKGAEIMLTDSRSSTVLTAEKKVGQGKVIWTGLNLVGMYQQKDPKSIAYLSYLFSLLIPDKVVDYPFDVTRSGPEKIKIKLSPQDQPTWFYWREAYYPTWRAKTGKQKLPIYFGGPSMILISVPPNTSEIQLYHSFHWTVILGDIISVVTLIGVVGIIVRKPSVKKEVIIKKDEYN